MKKLLVVALAAVIMFAFAAMAQETAGGKMAYGFKAGLGMSKWTGSELDTALVSAGASKKNLMGICGGAMLAYKFSPSVALQFEALYLLKGVKFSTSVADLSFKLSYIEVPVTLNLAPAMNGNFKPNFFGGPFIGLLASAKLKGSAGGASASVDIKDLFKSTDFGITFGAGFDYAMSSGALTFDARYDLGLSKVFKTEFELANKSAGFFFMFGYKFGK